MNRLQWSLNLKSCSYIFSIYWEPLYCYALSTSLFPPSGEHYLGMWQSNKFHGPGILIGKNEAFYSGQFREGEKMGSPTAAVLEQDDKWIPLFRWSAELLEQMV